MYYGLEIALIEGKVETKLLHTRDEALRRGLNYVYWSPDSRLVAVLRCGLPPTRLAFDRKSRLNVSFESVAPEFRDSIAKEYGLDLRLRPVAFMGRKLADEFEWACEEPGRKAFYTKHPQALDQ